MKHSLLGVIGGLPAQLYVDLVLQPLEAPALDRDVQRQLGQRCLRLPVPHVHLDELEHLRCLLLDHLVIRPDHGLLDHILERVGVVNG